jgi:hypothetical protein
MKICIIIILKVFFDFCTSPNGNKSIDGSIIGEWNTESCLPNFVHSVVTIQLSDISEIFKHRIKTNFSINLKQDNLFSFEHEEGSPKTGKYKITDNILTLSFGNDPINWLSFHIDSVTTNRLFLTSNTIQFYSDTTDSLKFFTGDNVDLILKRK